MSAGFRIDPASLAAGTVVGGLAGSVGLPYLVALASETTWISLAAFGLLSAGAVAVAFRGRGGPARSPADPNAASPHASARDVEPAARPEEWLRAAGAIGATDGEARDRIREALQVQLRPAADPLPPALSVLLRCLSTGIGKRSPSRPSPSARLAELDAAMALAAPHRSRRLAEMERSLAGDAANASALSELQRTHGTRESLFCAVLERARVMGGPLGSAEFLWLRHEDRNLWYALNNLGRRTFHVEGMAAMAHLAAERAAGVAMDRPEVESAVIPLARIAASASPLNAEEMAA